MKVYLDHSNITQNIHGASRNCRYIWDVLTAHSGKLKTNQSIRSEIPQASLTNPPKAMSQRDTIPAQEETRRKILAMTRRISITRGVRVLLRRHTCLGEEILTVPRPMWVKKGTLNKKPLGPKQNQAQGQHLDLNLMVFLV